MNFTHHPSTNMILGPPADMPNCEKLPATMTLNEETGERTITTFWKPTPEELALLNANGVIALWVWGGVHMPVWLSVEKQHV